MPKELRTEKKYRQGSGALHLMTSVGNSPDAHGEKTLRNLLRSGWWAFGRRAHGVKYLRAGDRICFYIARVGVVAEATVTGRPEERRVKGGYDSVSYPLATRVAEVRYFFDRPIIIDKDLRSWLDAFAGKDVEASGAWFVQSTRLLTEHDFALLVGRPGKKR